METFFKILTNLVLVLFVISTIGVIGRLAKSGKDDKKKVD